MEVQCGPNSVDESNLLYKLQRKFKVFNTSNALPNRGYNLVTSSSKYGIVFVASPNGVLSAYYLKELVEKECEPKYHSVKLEVQPTHILINCNQEWLAVIGGQKLYIYKVVDFQNQNVLPSGTLNCDVNPGAYVSSLQWNPCIPETIAIVFFDGTLLVCHVNTMQMKKLQTTARCLCWSPKGKQLVTGNRDGTLCQFKPDLSPMKSVPAPNLFEGSPVEALAIYWISTYQFAVVFKNATNDSRPAVTIVNTPKAGQPACYNYEDICYSLGSSRPWYYYLQGIAQWNLILSSSSNSMEIATLGSADGAGWFQWCQADEARPELPLTDKKQENYPVGICIDTCAIHQLTWGENEVLPTMPLLLVVSQTGLLSIFNIINLNKAAPQLCAPPQQLLLPAAVMTTAIPDDAPAQPATPMQPPQTVLVIPKPQSQQAIQPQQAPSLPQAAQVPSQVPQAMPAPQVPQFPSAPQVPQFNAASLFAEAAQAKPFGAPQQQPSFGFAAAQPPPPPPTQPTQPDVKPAATMQKQGQPQSVTSHVPPQSPPQNEEANAALRSEQEKTNKAKMKKELTDILVKEVNDFQMELYKFTLKTKETESRLQRDIENMNINNNLISLDTEKLMKECTLDDLRASINQLKLELVRACAVVAEARSHSETKDLPHWAQTDPLTAKRVDCVRKLAYYVQNQLDQARKALDLKWNAMMAGGPDNKQGKTMIRPVLEDVYQPLVKQQEILMRQQAVLKTMKNTLKECQVEPVFKSTSILRSTPFKKDLSKLTKNIINMKIEASDKSKETTLSSQKLDALRDLLSNHKPTKVKPVSVELRQQLAAIQRNYKKSLLTQREVKNETPSKSEPVQMPVQVKEPSPPAPASVTKIEPKPDIIKESPKIYTPVCDQKPPKTNFNGVARNLFADDAKFEPPKAANIQKVPFLKAESTSITPAGSNITSATKTLLKDHLENKSQAAANVETKNDPSNAFMGLNICSPTAFSFSKPSTAAAPSAIFASKPAPNVNTFGKFQQTNIPSDFKPQPFTASSKSTETGESDASKPPVQPSDSKRKEDKPMTNLFGLKPSATQSVPDVLKTNTKAFDFGKQDPSKITVTPNVNESESKENVAEKNSEQQATTDLKKENNTKPFTFQFSKVPSNAPSHRPVILGDFHKDKSASKSDVAKSGEEPPASIFSSSSSSSGSISPTSLTVTSSPILFGSTNISKSISVAQLPTSSTSGTSSDSQKSESESKTVTPSGSIFTSAVTTASVFTSTSTPGVVCGSTTTSQSATIGTSTAQSVFASATVKPSIFSAPTSATKTETSTTQSCTEEPQSLEKPESSEATTATSTPSSVFAAANESAFGVKSTSQSSIFAPSTTTTTTQSVFGITTTTASIFGSAPTSAQSIFSAAVSNASFGQGSTTQSIFGAATTTTPSSVFTASTTQSSVFGATTDPKSVFSATSTAATAFGSTSTPPSTSTSVFGTATTQSSSSIFGSTTTKASMFGGTTSTQASIFGTTTPTTQASVFGATSTQASVFGTTTATTQASVFGTPTPSTQASVFGTPTPATQASIFGTPTQTTQASVFGTPPQTTQASVFGTPTTAVQSASPFGGAEASIFAAASISTTSASNQGSAGSIFGASPSGSAFGSSNTNVFGGKTTFGQSNPTATNIFGGGTPFGQKPATDFWSGGGNTATSTFGSPGFGQAATTQASSIFGGASGGGFSAPAGAPAFGSPQTPAFGTPQQTASPAFGGSPVFGAKQVFGQPAGFGSPTAGGGFGSFGGFNKSPTGGFGAAATFGSGATFGGAAFGNTSPGKMFGSSSPNFAPSTQSNAMFESLATQNTLTFGNLAQHSGQPQPAAPPAFNQSPSFTGWRG